jgi:prolipoprotein diacylglyceryltransferase
MSFLPDWMWAYRYPHNVLDTPNTDPVPSVPIEGYNYEYNMQLSEAVFPTPFYEVMAMALVFAVLWSIRKRIKTPGMLFFIYLGLIAIERFMIEKIRVNVRHDSFLNLTQAQLIAMLLLIASVVGIIYTRNRHHNAKKDE